ncbi:MAG: flagellar basal body L-ring protein FlgH [Ignavibacteriales bacterium]|nr:flagellar basal body L-ring protein FlgH [Ignavibacteriales bacterium]
MIRTWAMRCVVLVCAAAVGSMVQAQDLRENLSRSLFSDQKANHVGDAVTVLVVEASSASNDSKTSSSRESGISLSGSAKAGATPIPDAGFNLGSGNTFKGSGATQSQGLVRASISARVDSILSNGNMWINGSRLISINGEEQVIKISGIIRPTDVQADNSVYSSSISDAKIVFEGSGMIDRSQGPGWLTKLFHWLF